MVVPAVPPSALLSSSSLEELERLRNLPEAADEPEADPDGLRKAALFFFLDGLRNIAGGMVEVGRGGCFAVRSFRFGSCRPSFIRPWRFAGCGLSGETFDFRRHKPAKEHPMPTRSNRAPASQQRTNKQGSVRPANCI